MSDPHFPVPPVQHIELAPNLWCVVFFPFAAAVVISYFGLTLNGASEKEKADATKTMTRVAAAGPLVSLAVALYYAFALFQLPPSARYFLLHVGNVLRMGQLDANVDFVLDPLAVTFVIVITGVGSAVALISANHAKDAAWRHLARVNALVAAALLFVMADDFIFALVGWGATGALASSLARAKTAEAASARKISFVVARIGDGALLLAAASLFWSFGGAFTDGDYIPDLDARYAAVSTTPTTAPVAHVGPSAKGTLTLASTPGALIFADDARLPLETSGNPVRSPIVRQSIDAGMHTFRVHPGSGLDDSIVAHVRFVEGAEVALVLVGATTAFREMRDQLLLTDDHGVRWRRDVLVARRAFGPVGTITFACLLLFIAAAARGTALPFETVLAGSSEAAAFPTTVLLQAIAACTGIYLLARVSFLFELSPVASTVVAIAGALTALLAAASACVAVQLPRFIGYLAAAHFGFALLAFGSGSVIDAVVLVAIASLALGALALSLAQAPSPQSQAGARVATYALAVAPIPGAGVSFAVVRALGAALISDRLTNVPGAILVAIGAVATAVLSYASWRWLYLAYKKDDKKAEKTDKKSRPTASAPTARHAWLALVGAAVVVGVVFDLGIVSGHPFTTDASWLAAWLSPGLGASTARESTAVDAIVFALGFGGALAGFAQARSRSLVRGALEKRNARLAASEASRVADGGLLPRVAASLTSRASLLARDTDRFVIDGVIGAGAGVVRLASRVLGGGKE